MLINLFKIWQIISLGAGFDTSFFRLRCQGLVDFLYVEIDFPEVMHRKQALFDRDPECSSVVASSQSYHLVPADLRDLPRLEAALRDVPGIDFARPTLFLSECSVTYMDESR